MKIELIGDVRAMATADWEHLGRAVYSTAAADYRQHS